MTDKATAAALINPLTRHQVFLQRLTAGEVQKFAPFLRLMDKEIRAQLSGDALTEFSRRRLENLLATTNDLLGGILGDYSNAVVKDLLAIAEHEAAFSARAIGSVIDIESGVPSATLIRAAVLNNPLSMKGPSGGKLLKGFIDDWTASERKAVTGAIRRGVFQGKTNSQIVQEIRGTKATRYQNGLLDVTARNAATVVRTAVQHVSSMARQATMDVNADIVKGGQWVATLDKRTCPQCRALDGLVFPIDKGPRPPIHPCDRCGFIPLLAAEYERLNKGATRASKGAEGGQQVDANLSYYDWLKTQPPEFVREALGPTRAKLFLNGGLSPKRFAQLQLDKNFEPLTLDEMKALEPLAFKKAGLDAP